MITFENISEIEKMVNKIYWNVIMFHYSEYQRLPANISHKLIELQICKSGKPPQVVFNINKISDIVSENFFLD